MNIKHQAPPCKLRNAGISQSSYKVTLKNLPFKF